MEVFVARQPIFTKAKDIFAYELLYRNNPDNYFPNISGDAATTDVIINSFINIGVDELSNGKICFINFTENLLKSRLPTYLNPNDIVVEILETVTLTEEILELCKELKCKGYKLALDDFVLNKDNPYSYPLLELADIVKVDYRDTSLYMRRIIERLSKKYNYTLLAEKVETQEEFESAIASGYEYFQGYFFSKPVILSTHDVPEYFQNYFVIISHMSQNEPDLGLITELIEQDLSLTYKLLKLSNSPVYGSVSKINSIKQAIVRLGMNELKKWLYILSIRGTITGKNEWSRELFNNSLIRAKVCDLISLHKNKRKESSSYFLTGLFSLMDALLGMEMEEILQLIPLQEDICEALLGQPNPMKGTLELTIAIERGAWEDVSGWCEKLQLPEEAALDCYHEAFKWANNLMIA
ncbi:EAL and HDOD domain-containing protein [Neobacillus drentensis]|uniref:EAL and HDOD domain-containing protein n=1 Tax=Neobacillus drentensis TaxID=220684 RepID=UPI003001D606